MKKPKNVRVPIYGDLIRVITSAGHVEGGSYWAGRVVDSDFENLGFVADDEEGRVLIYISPCRGGDRHATIAHECYHAAMKIMERVGIEVTEKNGGGEAAAYLLTWLVETTNKEIVRLEGLVG